MTALSADRMTPQKASRTNRVLPIKGATKVYAGGMGALDGSGRLVPMATATGLKGVGRIEHTVNNAGGDGAVSVEVKCGIFRWANSTSTDQITLADIGSDCYGVDDQTVAKTNGSSSRSVAGKVYDVDAQGVWVESY